MAERFRQEGRRAPVEEARLEVARRWSISEDTLRNVIRNGLDKEDRARVRAWAREEAAKPPE